VRLLISALRLDVSMLAWTEPREHDIEVDASFGTCTAVACLRM
jgi:hypothetical protein